MELMGIKDEGKGLWGEVSIHSGVSLVFFD